MKVTLITGASGGIGEAIAHAFAKRKNNLILVARNSEKLNLLCKKLRSEYAVEANFISADLSRSNATEEVFETILARKWEVETLVNNAGIGSGGEFGTRTLKEEMDQIQLNISSLVAMTQLFGNEMKFKRAGTIINVASVVAFAPVAYMANYGASKAFVKTFTQAIAQEYKPYRVHVMVFCPGLTKTNFNAAAGLESEAGDGLGLSYEKAQKILQTPEEVASELMRALDKKKIVAISGTKNSFAARLLGLLPSQWVAKAAANRYRKKVGMNSK